jgi:hypothetical protein
VRRARLAAACAVVVCALVPPAPASAADGPSVVCRFADDRLTEISGITWSAQHPGVYWVHNDSSGGPYLYAVDGSTCATLARIRVGGIGARDLEAVATGVDPAGRPVLWLGDIGDNRDSWPEVRLHAVREPADLVDQQVQATTYRFTYADGSHNAEALLASPTSPDVWVVTKQLARGGVWTVPLSTSAVTEARRVARVGGLVTDAAVPPDGSTFVLRDYLGARLFAMPPRNASVDGGTRVGLPVQPQGEAITFTADGSALLVASESDDALWSVPLPATASPDPSASSSAPSASAPSPTSPGSGDATGSASPPSSDVASSGGLGGGPAAWLLVAAAVAGAVGVAVYASRHHRR